MRERWSPFVVPQPLALSLRDRLRVRWLLGGRLWMSVPAVCKFAFGLGFSGYSLAETLRLRWHPSDHRVSTTHLTGISLALDPRELRRGVCARWSLGTRFSGRRSGQRSSESVSRCRLGDGGPIRGPVEVVPADCQWVCKRICKDFASGVGLIDRLETCVPARVETSGGHVMPTDPRDAERRARHDRQHQTPGRDAWFQGSRVRLDLNAEAAAQLRDALDRVARSDPTRGAALARLDVQLPDGRPLRLSVRLTDDGTIRDPDGAYRSSEGVAYVDVSGDFDTHVAARRVIDAATRPYHEVPRSEQAAAELDAARVDQALDGRTPTAKTLDDQTREVVRARAQQAADQTRDQRVADVVRRSRDLGIGWDR
jgi:hypothetical protein